MGHNSETPHKEASLSDSQNTHSLLKISQPHKQITKSKQPFQMAQQKANPPDESSTHKVSLTFKLDISPSKTATHQAITLDLEETSKI
jgi:hypothetical protein